MKRIIAVLLTLALLCLSLFALAEADVKPRLGYLAPYRVEDARDSLRADAFTYAARQMDVDAVIVRYAAANAEPNAKEDAAPDVATDGSSSNLSTGEEPAMVALRSMLEDDLDGLVIVPETVEQAVKLLEQASAAGVPVVIEGLDISSAYPPTPDPEDSEPRPFIANVFYPEGEAAYVAAKWLEDETDNPLLFHCALPTSSRPIQNGLRRALREARYLSLVDETNADANSVEAGRSAAEELVNSYAMFYCVLADSAELAEGCANALRGDDSMRIAALTEDADALKLLGSGVDLLVGEPKSLEAVRALQALLDYLSNENVPEGEDRRIELDAVTASANDTAHWISDADFEAAYENVWGS